MIPIIKYTWMGKDNNQGRYQLHCHFEGILVKGSYLPCVSMAGRVLLAGYPRFAVLCIFYLIMKQWHGNTFHIVETCFKIIDLYFLYWYNSHKIEDNPMAEFFLEWKFQYWQVLSMMTPSMEILSALLALCTGNHRWIFFIKCLYCEALWSFGQNKQAVGQTGQWLWYKKPLSCDWHHCHQPPVANPLLTYELGLYYDKLN